MLRIEVLAPFIEILLSGVISIRGFLLLLVEECRVVCIDLLYVPVGCWTCEQGRWLESAWDRGLGTVAE